MQDTDTTHEPLPVAWSRRPLFRRFLLPGAVLLPLLVIALVMPLINMNRFQRRIVTSLSESLGRPIHLDSISLTVFPLPGLAIENLVVGEDPAFGAEPFVRASSVRATLRISSLWRHRVEFSRISFTEPSINLVYSHDRWNLESILLHASKIDAAPTAQARSSASPRFPYIEATGARLNLKMEQEKTPLSLTEAEFALWLNNPQQWQLRLEGRPMRTDTDVSDTGTLRLEGTLGHAAALNNMPIDLKAEWRDAPLGGATHVLLGEDAGLRGSMTLAITTKGTVDQSSVVASLHLADLRRADFVPAQSLTIDVGCRATQRMAFRSLIDLGCNWPPALFATTLPRTFVFTGNIPDTRHLASATFELGTPGIPAPTLLSWLRIASDRISPAITATGTLAGDISRRSVAQWSGQWTIPDGTLTIPSITRAPVFTGALTLRVASLPGSNPLPQLVLAPVSLSLGGNDFATLDGRFEQTGYTLHLTGTSLPAKLRALGSALPPIGDGLSNVLPPAGSATPFRFDLLSTRAWNGAQVWHQNGHPAPPRHRQRR